MRISDGSTMWVPQVELAGPSQKALNSVPVSQSKLEEDFRDNEHTAYNRFFLRCIKEFGVLLFIRQPKYRCNGDTLAKRYQETFLEPRNCCIWRMTKLGDEFWPTFQRDYEGLLKEEGKYKI